jgi:hypothetical protein
MTENLRQRPGDQPLPTEGQENVQDALIARILSSPRLGAGANELAVKIMQRRKLGVERYGRPLQTFNGRDAVQDLLDELLDGATYAMQIKMEREATQARIDAALAEHQADFTGQCYACRIASPCPTRRILTGQQTAGPITVTRVDPVQEIVCSPDAIDFVRERFQITEAQTGIPDVGEYMGLPVYVDDVLPPRTVRLRPSTPKQ